MCGIAGIARIEGPAPSLDELQSMVESLVHRGPDAEGLYVGGDVAMGMRRLAIIDVDSGAQPIRNEDGTIWTVFNGEIYNHRALRESLEKRGHAFYTASDTETIVHLYEEFGPRCVERLRGMFALAIWDTRRRRLILARDRVGIKPLYYTLVRGRLLFASEIKALLALPEVPREIDGGALAHLLGFLTTPSDRAILSGIRKLEPGTLLVAGPSHAPHVERYWSLRLEPDYSKPVTYFEDGLRAHLDESVRLHLESDVPVGAFLSGGVDSSSIVATMSRFATDRIKTFSIGFKESTHDESAYARLVAERFGTEHHERIVQPRDVFSILEDLVWHLDEPFADSSAIPTYIVCRLAAEHVKVVLSGDGGDEAFAGYDRYLVEQRERRCAKLPRWFRRALAIAGAHMPDGMRGRNLLRHVSLDDTERYLDAGTLFRRAEQLAMLTPTFSELTLASDPWADAAAILEARDGHWLTALQRLDFERYLPLDILTKVDRMSMAHSLEARVPLLDHRLLEFAATIPPEFLLDGDQTKIVLKRALHGTLPDAILTRPKQGFAVPLGTWFRGPLRGWVRDILLSQRARERGVFDPAYVKRLLERHDHGRELDLHVWTLVVFELWCRSFLDARSRPSAHAPTARRSSGSRVACPREPGVVWFGATGGAR
jgi:asparagine synthase (glutamine-hydrolysing)